MISYSQNREDVLLARVLKDIQVGFYVDVGANDPTESSVTRHFYDLGWNGINIEPGMIFQKLSAGRPKDINLNLAVSNHSGTATFLENPIHHGLSTLSKEIPASTSDLWGERIERTVALAPLREILEKHAADKTIDFMSIDVEGHEKEVLEGNDWSRFRPRIVLLEATVPCTPIPSFESWEPILLSNGYLFAYFDGLNRFYVRIEDRERLGHLSVPVNHFDNFQLAEVVNLQRKNEELALALFQVDEDRSQLLAQLQARECVSLTQTMSVAEPTQAFQTFAQPAIQSPRPTLRMRLKSTLKQILFGFGRFLLKVSRPITIPVAHRLRSFLIAPLDAKLNETLEFQHNFLKPELKSSDELIQALLKSSFFGGENRDARHDLLGFVSSIERVDTKGKKAHNGVGNGVLLSASSRLD
jgi:FkbM family methyltransferase